METVIKFLSNDYCMGINQLATATFGLVTENLENHRAKGSKVWDGFDTPEAYFQDLLKRVSESLNEASFQLSAYTYCGELKPDEVPTVRDLVVELVTISILNTSEGLKLPIPERGLLSLIALNPILYYPDSGAGVDH